MAGLSAENALRIWQAKGLLSPEQVNDLRAALAENETGERSGRGVAIFSMLGAVLLGAGPMLFVGSNWDIAPPGCGSLWWPHPTPGCAQVPTWPVNGITLVFLNRSGF